MVEYFTVAENMFLGREQTKGGFISKQKMFADAATELKKLKIDLDPKMLVGDLSVSQQQMLVIAKVLSLDAEKMCIRDSTWIEQQGKTSEELNALWYDVEGTWDAVHAQAKDLDALINEFNEETGLLKSL